MPYWQQISKTLSQKHDVLASFSLKECIGGDSGAQIDVMYELSRYFFIFFHHSFTN